MAVVGDAEPDAVRAAGGDHAIAFGRVHRHRLLAEHVLAGLGRGDGLFGVEMDRRRHVHRVDLGIADEIAPVGVPPAGADLARERLDELGSRAADGHELAPAAVPQRLADAFANDVAGADQAPSHSVQSSRVLRF